MNIQRDGLEINVWEKFVVEFEGNWTEFDSYRNDMLDAMIRGLSPLWTQSLLRYPHPLSCICLDCLSERPEIVSELTDEWLTWDVSVQQGM